MSEFPFGFNYETLITDEDRALRKLALTLYSEDAADYIAEKYTIDDNWQNYADKVTNLISRKLPEAEFIREIQQLNLKTPRRLY